MNNYFPILKNVNQFEKYKNENFYIEHLFVSDKKNSPIILYGEDQGNLIMYSPSVSPEADQKIKEQALQNLKQINVPVQIENVQGNDILIAQHEYASEKILDKDFLLQISKKLGSSSILVGIPVKGFLAACAQGKGDNNLYGAVNNMYKNPQTYPISNSLFFVQNGEIEMMSVPKTEKTENDLSINGEFDSNNKIGFKVYLKNDTEDGIADQIQEAYQSILAQIPGDPKKYNGKIAFYLPKDVKLTESLKKRLIKMAKNISERGAVQIIGALIGDEFSVKFYDANNRLIAETIDTEPVQLKQNAQKTTKKTPKKKKSVKNNSKKWWQFWK